MRRSYFVDDEDTFISEVPIFEVPVIKTYPPVDNVRTSRNTEPYFHAPTRIILEVS